MWKITGSKISNQHNLFSYVIRYFFNLKNENVKFYIILKLFMFNSLKIPKYLGLSPFQSHQFTY